MNGSSDSPQLRHETLPAAFKLLRAITSFSAENLLFALAFITASLGIGSPEANAMLVPALGANAITEILKNIAGGRLRDDERIREQVQAVIDQSGIASKTDMNELSGSVSSLVHELGLLEYAERHDESVVLRRLSELDQVHTPLLYELRAQQIYTQTVLRDVATRSQIEEILSLLREPDHPSSPTALHSLPKCDADFIVRTAQVELPAHHWAMVTSFGEPPSLTPDLFLANRKEAIAKFKEVLDGIAPVLKLTTHYPDQVADFVSAYLASVGDETRPDAEGRCLIVSGIDAWNGISSSEGQKYILVAAAALDLSGDTGTKLIQKARRAGHAVIFGGLHSSIPGTPTAPLPMPTSQQIEEALEKAGYAEQRARTLAQKSDGNLSSLLRLLQNLLVLPKWAEGSDADELTIAVLLGSWSEKSDADRAIADRLSGKPYGEWIREMRGIALRPATPIIQQGSNWRFIPRYEGWYALGPRLFDEHLERLRIAAVSVLREKDPQFDLDPEDRYMASIRGKVLSHSRLLRNGLADTLALVGSHPKALKSCSSGKAEATAVLAVRAILEDANWLQWASLNDLLPLLAEAAPREFLDSVEKALQDPCPFDAVFAQERSGIFGSNYMTGLLWALETLAWDPDYLTRAAVCLGQLAARDPGGNWGNRPANSLTTVFLPWLPQTCASVAKRVTAVKTLLTELPDVGWKLLLGLLPQPHSVSTGTRRPAWRPTIPDDWRQPVTNSEHWEQVTAYAELAVGEAKRDASKIGELTESLENLPQPAQEQFLDYLGSQAVLAMAEADRLQIWNQLVKLTTTHRKFADAEWAMAPDQLEKIAALTDRHAPDSPFFLHQRLFDESDFDLYEEQGDYEKQRNQLAKRRQEAVQQIAASGGTEAVLDFAKAVHSPWLVGAAFGAVANPDADAIVLPDLLETENKSLAQFTAGFVRGRFHSKGWEWVDGIDASHWAPTQTGQFFSFLPFSPDAWQRVNSLLRVDQSVYWTKTTANPYEANGGLGLAVDHLVENGRPWVAIRCLYKMLQDKQPLDSRKTARILIEALKSSESPHSHDVYEATEIIKALQRDRETNSDDMLQVEWQYLPLLDAHHRASPELLWRRLADDPGAFCQAIRLAFRSMKEEGPAEDVTEERKNAATNAYRLLSEWSIPPGLSDDGVYDGNALKTWLDAVRKECTETGHVEIAMEMVGHVLTHVPPDPDGLWIHHAVADALNAKDDDDMRNGFRTELYNSRGVHRVDPTGKPEKELAAKYRAQAEAVESAGYQRLAATLLELSKSYEREAERVSSRDLFDD